MIPKDVLALIVQLAQGKKQIINCGRPSCLPRFRSSRDNTGPLPWVQSHLCVTIQNAEEMALILLRGLLPKRDTKTPWNESSGISTSLPKCSHPSRIDLQRPYDLDLLSKPCVVKRGCYFQSVRKTSPTGCKERTGYTLASVWSLNRHSTTSDCYMDDDLQGGISTGCAEKLVTREGEAIPHGDLPTRRENLTGLTPPAFPLKTTRPCAHFDTTDRVASQPRA